MKTTVFTIEEQLSVKSAICKEFNLVEKRVSKSWLSIIDAEPDPNNPEDWDYLLENEKLNIYVNLKFFPRITIEPTHTDSYNLGVINYKKGMTPQFVVDYLHNILDEK